MAVEDRPNQLVSLGSSRARARAREEATAQPTDGRSSEAEWAALLDVRGALTRLKPDLRAPLEAVQLEGLSVAEAAARLGIAKETVKRRVHRARRILREETG